MAEAARVHSLQPILCLGNEAHRAETYLIRSVHSLVLSMPLQAAIEQRYPQTFPRMVAMRERLIEVCQAFLDGGFGDGNAEQRLCSADDGRRT